MANQEEVTESTDSSSSSHSLPKVRELTLEEARHRYDDEETRRTSVESKIGTVITIDALIISVVGIFSPTNPLFVLSMILALVSSGIGLWALRTRNYNRPGKELDDFLQYDQMTAEQQRKQLLFDYILAIEGNEDAENPEDREVGNHYKTNTKYKYFDACVFLTGLALLFILGVSLSAAI